MIQSTKKSNHYFRNGVKTLSSAMALVAMISIPSSAQEILFSPGQAGGQNIGEFEISPDGTQVAFSGVQNNGITEPGQQTYVAGVLPGPNLGTDPAPRIGVNTAVRVDPTGSGDNDGGVKWTPDGLSVITRFTPTGAGNANEIWRLSADGSQIAQQLTFNSTNAFDPQVSADGNSLFYSDVGSLFVTPIVGASATSSIRLNPGTTAGEISEIDTGTYAQVGSDIIFSGFATPVPGADNGTRQDTFYRTAADGSTANSPTMISITNLPTDTALNFGAFDVTVDGQTIITQGDLLNNGVTQLFGLSTAGGEFTPLFDDPRPAAGDFDVNFFKLSNDGSTVLFVSDFLQNGIGQAFVVPSTGGTPILVSDGLMPGGQDVGLDAAFTGAPDRLGFSPDDQFIYYVADGGLEGNHDGTFTLHRAANPLFSAIPEPTALPLLFAASAFFLRRKR